jgi:hypothetical protein
MLIDEKGAFPINEKCDVEDFIEIVLKKINIRELPTNKKCAPEQLNLFDC